MAFMVKVDHPERNMGDYAPIQLNFDLTRTGAVDLGGQQLG